MYDMYPEWGPAGTPTPRTRSEQRGASRPRLDLRDNGGQRPDDN